MTEPESNPAFNPDTALAGLFVIGARFGAAPAALRDRLFYEDDEAAAEAAALRAAGLADAVAVSTCDRVEIWGVGDPAIARAALLARAGGAAGDAEDALTLKRGGAALEHIFCVAGSLDSMVIGEPQVLGQVKACHRLARGTSTGPLDAVLDAAYACARRIRTETRIGEGPVSLASAARAVARDIHGALSDVETLMLGGGDMGVLLAEQLIKDGVKGFTVLHSRPRRAEALAGQLGCRAAPLDDLGRLIDRADILIAAGAGTGAGAVAGNENAVTADLINAALKRRRRKPMFILDLAFPGDAEAAVNRIEDAYLYDLSDLERIAADAMKLRAGEAARARKIAAAAAVQFERARAARGAVPAVTRLRDMFEAERIRSVAEGGGAEAVSRRLVNRLLHAPSVALKTMAAENDPGGDAAERLLMRLFEKDAPEDES
ncbi:MAG: glutamyl-tRNA reductase [Rhodospirillales bacterium]